MAGERVNTYAQDDSDILALQLTTDKTFKGYHQLTLTNYDNTTVPAIAAGSAIECNGALYKFDTEEAISTTDPVTSAAVADGTVYVCIVPGATTCTAAFTATAPTWSDSKQGWYGTGGQANYRYAEYVMYKDSSIYALKDSLFVGDKRNLNLNLFYKANGTQTISTNGVKVLFQNKQYDIPGDGSFDVSTGIFTVPETGCYSISHGFSTYSTTITGSFQTSAGTPGDLQASTCFNIALSNPLLVNMGNVFFLKKNDQVYCSSNLMSGAYLIGTNVFVKIKRIS